MAQYADITEIAAPSSAVPGSTVSISVGIKNIHSSPISIMAVAYHSAQGAGEYISGLYPRQATATVSPGAMHAFSGSFVMPSSTITIYAYSYWYGTDNAWHLDDQMSKQVSVQTLTPQITEFRIYDYNKV